MIQNNSCGLQCCTVCQDSLLAVGNKKCWFTLVAITPLQLLQDSMMLFAQDSQRKKAAEFSEVTDDTDTAQDEHTTTYACHRVS